MLSKKRFEIPPVYWSESQHFAGMGRQKLAAFCERLKRRYCNLRLKLLSSRIAYIFICAVFLGQLQAVADTLGSLDPTPTNKMSGIVLELNNRVGSWIWCDKTTHGQQCQFWKSFKVDRESQVTNAILWITVDDEFTVYLDGRELGSGTDWRDLFAYDVTPLLGSGSHVLAVDAYNQLLDAGLIAGLQISYADGRIVNIVSDTSWRIVSNTGKRWKIKTEPEAGWPRAKVVVSSSGEWWNRPRDIIAKPLVQTARLAFWQTGWFQTISWGACILIALFSVKLIGQLALHRKEERLLKLERLRIAREIHDDIGSGLTQLVLNGEVAQRSLPPDSKEHQQLEKICNDSRRLLAGLDEILWVLNPQWDTIEEFVAYACKYTEEFLKPTSIQCFFDVPSQTRLAAFSLPLRRSLLGVVKEALNNAVKHSGATELRFGVHCEGNKLLVVIQDNGKGFDAKSVKEQRNGLKNMVQRVEDIGGRFKIYSEPGKGCRVEFGVQLAHRTSSSKFSRQKDSGFDMEDTLII